MVVWCDSSEEQGPLHTNFKLSKEGDDVALFDTVDHGNVLVHGFGFGLQGDDVAYGYFPEGSDPRPLDEKTFLFGIVHVSAVRAELSDEA